MPMGNRRSETGKLYPEQGQIGELLGRKSGGSGVASLSGRPLEVSGNRHRRWMTVPDRKVGTELGLQAISLARRSNLSTDARPHFS